MSIYWQAPTSKYSSIMTWRRTHGIFVVTISPPVLGSPPWAEGTSSDELWPLVSPKYSTQACVASWETAQEQLHPDPLFQAEQQARNKAGTSRNGRTTHTGQFGAQNLDCCTSLKRFAFSILITEGTCDTIWILHLLLQGGMNTQTYPSITGIDQLESERYTFECSLLKTGAQGSSRSPWFLTKVTSAVSLPITHKKCQLA